jgi:hypothetical protein
MFGKHENSECEEEKDDPEGQARQDKERPGHSMGFVAQGHATGALTFANGRGTVTVALVGPAQHGFARLPQACHFRVAAGTGAYQHLTGESDLRLVLWAGTFVLTIQ